MSEFGYRFLSYVLAVEPERIKGFVERGEPLEQRQREALSAAIDVLAEVLEFNGIDPSEHRSLGYWVELAVGQVVDGDLSRPNALRLHAGGDLPERRDADPLRDLLLRYAREAYPFYLLAPRDGRPQGGGVGASRIALQLPAARAFQRRILQHPLLRDRFEPHADLASTLIRFPASTGIGGTVLYALLVMMTDHAWWQCRASVDASVERFLEESLESLSLFYRIVSGEHVPRQIVYGIRNVQIEGNSPVRTPWGNLISLDGENDLAPWLIGSYPPHIPAPFVALISSIDDESPISRGSPDELERVERPGMLLRLSLGLTEMASGRTPATGELAWWYTREPLGSGMWGDAHSAGERRSVVKLAHETQESFSSTCFAVGKNHPAHLDLAAARLVAAAGDRHDPADALIDAVIAWEGMFGSGDGEVATRVSVAIAILLTEKVEDRRELAKEVKKIYHLRSRMVHGAINRRGAAIAKESNRAIDLGFRAIKAIYDCPHLRQLKKSSERSDLLLLSGTPLE